MSINTTPNAFLWRRLHSLAGLWLVLFVIFHLFTNSQAALLFGYDGAAFIHSVNAIHDTPFLPVVEIALLGFPILIHTIWGIKYLVTAKYNSFGETGHTPYLPEYSRNHAYTWQRITSWLLIAGITAHVVHMRFIEYPSSASKDQNHFYMVRVTEDEGLHTLAARLDVQLYTPGQVQAVKEKTPSLPPKPTIFTSKELVERQAVEQDLQWLKALEKRPLKEGELMAVSKNFGTAEMLMVRDTFKNPYMIALYTLLVLATCFHAFNGLWTWMISWGVTLTQRAQNGMRTFCTVLMLAVAGMGLAAIWLTYWINLKS